MDLLKLALRLHIIAHCQSIYLSGTDSFVLCLEVVLNIVSYNSAICNRQCKLQTDASYINNHPQSPTTKFRDFENPKHFEIVC